MKGKKKIDVGTLWWALFLFRQLDRNGSISLKCMACNHFVALSVRCCAIITELARYNENKIDTGTLWWTTCLQSSCGIIKWVPKDFFADNVSMKSRLLDGMLRFLEHAPALEILWPKLWIFQQFFTIGWEGGSWLRWLVSYELVVEERNSCNRLSLGRITFTENMKRFGGILLAAELYTFDQFLGVFLVI